MQGWRSLLEQLRLHRSLRRRAVDCPLIELAMAFVAESSGVLETSTTNSTDAAPMALRISFQNGVSSQAHCTIAVTSLCTAACADR